MPWSGSAPSQQFTRTDGTRSGDDTWQQAAAATVGIEADDHDVHDTDIADGIDACLKKDGGNTAAANLPMGGFRHTNVGAAAARTQYARYAEVQDNVNYVATVGGTADAITLTPSIAITAYAAGQRFSFIASGDNTTAVTVNISTVGDKDIRLNDGSNTALTGGEIQSGAIVDILYDGTRFLLLGVLALDADLTAIAAISSTGILRRSGSNTWAVDADVTHLADTTADRLFGTDGSGNSGLVTLSGLTLSAAALSVDAASDTAAGKIEIAVQAEMEAASDTGRAVVPGRQHFHPGHPKMWGYATVSGNVPTLQTSYNVTEIADTATGVLTVTIATDFSSANWCAHVTTDDSNSLVAGHVSSRTGGSLVCRAVNEGDNAEEPDAWNFSGLGDQA